VVQQAQTVFPKGDVIWGDGQQGPHEAGWLALEVARARTTLGVAPRWDLPTSVGRTLDWYRQQAAGADARGLCLADIDAFEATKP
jgi:CDP-glucose 4,6-dehydratase